MWADLFYSAPIWAQAQMPSNKAGVPPEAHSVTQVIMGLGIAGFWLVGLVAVLVALVFIPRLFGRGGKT